MPCLPMFPRRLKRYCVIALSMDAANLQISGPSFLRVIDQLALLYKHDAEAKEQNMTAEERLAYHQEWSAPHKLFS